MTPTAPARPPRGLPRFLWAAMAAAVLAGMVFHGPVDSAGWPFARTIRDGALRAGETVGHCWEAIAHACEVAAESMRVLVRIGRESTVTPAVRANIPQEAVLPNGEPHPGWLIYVHHQASRAQDIPTIPA